MPTYAIESVSNALRVLLMFKDTPVLRVTDVSEALGVARSTAHRLLRTLVHQRFVQQERSAHAYRLGPALLEFQLMPTQTSALRDASAQPMLALSQAVNETVNLLVLEGAAVRFINSVEGSRQVRVAARTGSVLPAHVTAGGKLLLSATPDGDSTVTLKPLTSRTIVDRTEFQEELEHIRRVGYAINQGESLDGLHAIGVGVRDRGSAQVVASLAVSVPADRGGTRRLRKFLPALLNTADQIEQTLS